MLLSSHFQSLIFYRDFNIISNKQLASPDRVTTDFYHVREKKILIITEKGWYRPKNLSYQQSQIHRHLFHCIAIII